MRSGGGFWNRARATTGIFNASATTAKVLGGYSPPAACALLPMSGERVGPSGLARLARGASATYQFMITSEQEQVNRGAA